MENKEYMVRVMCMTYNHTSFIEDAMNGFCMQETSFPFVCTIIDDASVDGEPAVIKKYLQTYFDLEDSSVVRKEETEDYILTFAQHKTNKKCFFLVLFLKYNHYRVKKQKEPYLAEWANSKYIALCEGDDYWIDPLKLQKQIAYMESHPECALCFTGAKVIFDNGFEKVDRKEYKSLYYSLEERDYDGIELLKNWILPTASILYRNGVNKRKDNRFMFGDIIIGLSAAEQGTVHCIPEKMIVYRRNSNGLSVKPHPLPNRINHYKAIAEVFGDKYQKTCKHHITRSIASSLLTGDKNDKKDAVNAIKQYPKYVPKVFLSMLSICLNALKKRIFDCFL